MLIENSITTFQELANALQINPAKASAENIQTLSNWCRQHIKSDFSGTTLKSVQSLFDCYAEMNRKASLKEIVDNNGYAVIHKACKLGFDVFMDACLRSLDERSRKEVLAARTKIGNTPLHMAALFGHMQTLEVLLDYEADPNLSNEMNKLPIHFALIKNNDGRSQFKAIRHLLMNTRADKLENRYEEGKSILIDLVPLKNMEIIRDVLNKNQNLMYMSDVRGQNLLHHAIIQDFPELISSLAEDDKLVQQLTENGSSALHLACRYGSKAVILSIMEKSAHHFKSHDEHGKIPFDYLSQRPELQALAKDMMAVIETEGSAPTSGTP